LQRFVAKNQELNFAFSKTGNSKSCHCAVPAVAVTIKAAGGQHSSCSSNTNSSNTDNNLCMFNKNKDDF